MSTLQMRGAPKVEAPLTVTVLIPAHNEDATIGKVLESVERSTYPVERVIVAADACTDATVPIARAYGVEVYQTDCKDKAGAQNSVLDLITSDVVVGFDGDTFPDPMCIEKMMRWMVEHDCGAVGSTVLPVQPKGFFVQGRRFAYALGRRWWRWAQSSVGRVQVLTGASYAFKTEAIKKIGGFPSVGISADMDATWSLHDAGYKLAYVGEAMAYTVDPDNFHTYHQQMQRWASGFFQTMAKHKHQLHEPRSALVVWTALFDLLCLPIGYGSLAWFSFAGSKAGLFYLIWYLARQTLNTVLVSTVVGWKTALKGIFPFFVLNFYNKALYLWTFFREWILDSHWGSWTGRQGRAKIVTPIRPTRVAGLLGITAVAVGAYVALRGVEPPPVWAVFLAMLVIPAFAVAAQKAPHPGTEM